MFCMKVSGDDKSCGSVVAEPAHRSQPVFEPAVVGLHPVVAIPLMVTPGGREEFVKHRRVGCGPVGDHLGRPHPGRGQRALEEPAHCGSIAPRADVDIYDLPELFHGLGHIAPGSADLHADLAGWDYAGPVRYASVYQAFDGSNVAIVIGFVLLVTRWARAGPRLAALLCALALVGFVILVRPSPSVLRAAALVMVDPQLAADAGFALSVLATAGLLLIAPGWRDALRERGVPAGLAESLAIPAAAQVACAPVIAAISGTVGLAAIPANLVAVPAVAPATVLGVAAALLSACWPAAAEWVAWLAGWPAWWLVMVARYGADAPAGVAPWPAGVVGGMLLAALLAVVLVAGRRPVVRRLVAVAAVATVVGVLPVRVVASGWPPPGWFVVACDVGQGDAVVLPVGPDQAAVVDAGPDPAATDRCLRGLGVRHVNLLLITHFHADHVGGFAGVFRGRSVAEVVTTGHPEPAAGRDAVLAGAAAEGVPVRAATAGAVYRLGGVQLFVLGPVRPLTGTRSDPNNNSLVVRAEIRGRRVLLAGDAEEDEQRGVLSAAGPSGVRADVLKLAHHGSVYQDAGFLDAVAPAVALVSVGAGNPYGHPNTAVLGRLARGGARVLRTDVDADVAVVVTPGGLAVVARGQRPGRRPP